MSFEIPAGELVNLHIKKLSLVTSPASRSVWIIRKSNGGGIMEELLDIYNDIFDEEITQEEISKAEFSAAGAKDILKVLGKYSDDFPEELLEASKKLSKLLIGFAGYGYKYPEKKGDEFSGIEKSKDKWKSLGMTGDQSELSQFIQKVSYILQDDLSALRITKDGEIKSLGQKKGIEGHGGGGELDPTDKWPSFGPY